MAQRTSIEWCDYTINPVKGLCPMACSYCYARRIYKRFKWDGTIRFDKTVINDTYLIQKQPNRKKIFIGSTMELFGDWVKFEWLNHIFSRVAIEHWNDFIFLTKRPENLIKWSPFPANCWVGVSATDWAMMQRGTGFLRHIQASVKFVSFEPLLRWQPQNDNWLFEDWRAAGISWIIIGQQTPVSPKTRPKIEWIKEIVDVADKAKIPVFLKDNLRELICDEPYKLVEWAWGDETGHDLRQEFPSVSKSDYTPDSGSHKDGDNDVHG